MTAFRAIAILCAASLLVFWVLWPAPGRGVMAGAVVWLLVAYYYDARPGSSSRLGDACLFLALAAAIIGWNVSLLSQDGAGVVLGVGGALAGGFYHLATRRNRGTE